MHVQAPTRRLVLASGNSAKLGELAALLLPLGCFLQPQSDFQLTEAEEPHPTFVENALAKARHACACTGLPALADDSGLCVDALGGAPGVRSARYAAPADAGRAGQDAANNSVLLQRLGDNPRRDAVFVCVVVALRHADDPEPLIAQGRLAGRIGLALAGQGGFGYDPLFVLPDHRTLAQCDAAEKNRISHRAQALQDLLPMLRARWGWTMPQG